MAGRTNIENCITFYQFAEKQNLPYLKGNCLKLIALNWNNFSSEHFIELSAPLFYRILKRHGISLFCEYIIKREALYIRLFALLYAVKTAVSQKYRILEKFIIIPYQQQQAFWNFLVIFLQQFFFFFQSIRRHFAFNNSYE